jgi:uncharacterized protein (DUF1499 family)
MGRRLALLATLALGVALATAWPRLNTVETGRTPEYPELRPQELAAGPEQVRAAVKALLGRLPGWSYVGEGSGPAGMAIQAAHTGLFRLREDVTVTIRRERGRSVVQIRSRSRLVPWDLGQNARNIRAFQAALEGELR